MQYNLFLLRRGKHPCTIISARDKGSVKFVGALKEALSFTVLCPRAPVYMCVGE